MLDERLGTDAEAEAFASIHFLTKIYADAANWGKRTPTST